jgi:hypothetical protein
MKQEFQKGISLLKGVGRVHLTEDDFDTITEQGR